MRRAGSPMYSGKTLERQLGESVRACGGVYFRLVDSTFIVKGATMSRKSSADAFVFIPKDEVVHVVLAECKAEGTKSISFDRLAPHQEDALLDMEKPHDLCHGVVVVNFYDNVDVRRMNRLFMVPIKAWVEERDLGKRKSLSISDCENDISIVECDREAPSWNLKPWVDSLIQKEEQHGYEGQTS